MPIQRRKRTKLPNSAPTHTLVESLVVVRLELMLIRLSSFIWMLVSMMIGAENGPDPALLTAAILIVTD